LSNLTEISRMFRICK